MNSLTKSFQAVFSIVFLFSILLLASCGGDKDPAPTSKIVGKWSVESSQTIMTVGGKTYEQYLIDEFGLSALEAKEFADLMADLLTLSGYFAELEIKADGTWKGDSDFANVTGKWTLSSDEKTLTLTNDAAVGEVQTATITKLTDTDLWLEMGVNPDDLPVGTPTNFSYTGLIKMKRI